MAKAFFLDYLSCINNSDSTKMSEYWFENSFMKNYVIESHRAVFSTMNIESFLIDFIILYEQEHYVIFEEKSKYVGGGHQFSNNITKSVWVAIKLSGGYKFLSSTTLSVHYL